jgi:hypothetical protein
LLNVAVVVDRRLDREDAWHRHWHAAARTAARAV